MKTHNSLYCDYLFNIQLSRPKFYDGKSYVCPVLGCIPRAKVLKYLLKDWFLNRAHII